MKKARYWLLGTMLAGGLFFVGCEETGEQLDDGGGTSPFATETPAGGGLGGGTTSGGTGSTP